MIVPKHHRETLAHIAAEAEGCQRCPLFRDATQVVFGEGPVDAAIVMVGEQPGDQEDRAGRPFVGPAGRILDAALAEAGLARAHIYVTNAVKHFKHVERGKRRLHKKPNQSEIDICRWWLDRELALVAPKLVVALGVTAAQVLAGRRVVLARMRGQLLQFPGDRAGLVTQHPSAILRVPEEVARKRAFADFVRDLVAARQIADAA
jgi:uracil-DNA glycosylase